MVLAELHRILGYLDLRAQLIAGTPAEYSCLAGTMVQEAFLTHPDVRDACAVSILGHAATLETDFAAALAAIDAPPQLDVASLARYTQVVLQGAFVVSKAANDSAVVLDAIAHLRRYLEAVFHRPTNKEEPVVSTPPTARRRRRAAPVTALDKEIISQQVGDPVTVTIERRIDG